VAAAASVLCALLALVPIADAGAQPRAGAQTKPDGEMRWALYVTLSPVWFDPGEFQGLTAFWVLYAIHDALVKPMPGNLMTPSLAEGWTVSADQKVYEFKLREGLKFHNGDPFTAEDVKFSFQRAKGSKILHDKVREVVIVDPYRVRFVLNDAWPDFMTFYGTLVSGASWVVPKKYVERVGDDGFKKQPVGLGPYKFVSHAPGIELVMEAFEGYWRKVPSVKRLVFKSVPDSITRAAMLKRGEVDVAYLLDVPQAQEIKRDPALRLMFSGGIAAFFLDFLDQWDPKSPWADRRVRLAANYAIDRKALSEAETLGASKPAGSIVPAQLRVRAADRAVPLRSREGAAAPDGSGLSQGVRRRRAASAAAVFLDGRVDRELSGRRRHQAQDAADGARRVHLGAAGAEAARAVRVRHRGLRQRRVTDVRARAEHRTYAYGGYPDIDGLYKEQALVTDRRKREALLHQIQQLLHERVRFGPIWDYVWPSGVAREWRSPR
jgi:peptide/nickel transport system substrate-binding protein